MKKALFSIIVLTTILSSCSEPFSYTPPIDTSTIVDSSFRVGGLKDVNTKKAFNYKLPVTVGHQSGTPKNVSLSVTGLPPNTVASFTPPSGTAPFASTLTIKTENTALGIYVITVEANAAGFAPQKFPINLQVDTFSKVECNDFFYKIVAGNPPGDLTTYDANNFIHSKTTTVVRDDISGELFLKNVFLNYVSANTGDNFFATQNVAFSINCNTNTITVPYQVIYGKASNGGAAYFVVTGTGVIDLQNNQYSITYKSDNNYYTLKGTYKL